MMMRRRVRRPHEDATHNLLIELIETPAADARMRPVALRSIKQQRRTVLAPYPQRTWFDHALTIAERLLAVIVVGFFGWWLIDGYGRDWWHARQTVPVAVASQLSVAAAPAPTIVPTAPHPELGASLPVVDERSERPHVSVDYLAPAHSYIAPLLPTPVIAAQQAPTPEPQPAAPLPIDLRPTRLTIPAINLDSNVVEVFIQDGAWQVADYAVGYHHGTGVVGRSNMVLAGHKGLRGGVFRSLEQIKPGDEIVVEAGGQRYQYRARATASVWPSQVDVMFPTEHPQLTLLTCTNWDTQRFIVLADFVGALPSGAAAGGN